MKRPTSQAGIIYDTFELTWQDAYNFVIQNLTPKMAVSSDQKTLILNIDSKVIELY